MTEKSIIEKDIENIKPVLLVLCSIIVAIFVYIIMFFVGSLCIGYILLDNTTIGFGIRFVITLIIVINILTISFKTSFKVFDYIVMK